MQKTIVYFVSLVVLAVAGYFLWTLAPRESETVTAISTAQQVNLERKTVKEETAEYAIDGEYPRFGVPAIDAIVSAKIDTAMNNFRDYPVNPPEFGLPKNEQSISYSDVYVGDDIVSLSLSISEYTGGAHPNTVTVGVNVDRKTGKEITVTSALALVGKSLQQVATESLARLKAELGDDVIFPDGAAAKTENYSTFTIDKESVTFIFNNYQVAPYAAGQQEVTFPRK